MLSLEAASHLRSFDDAVGAERRRNATYVLPLRATAAALWFASQLALLPTGSPVAVVTVPRVGVYALSSVALWLACKRSPKLFDVSWYAIPLLDLPAGAITLMAAIGALGAIPTLALPPQAMAAFSLLYFAVIVAMSQLALRRRLVIITAAAAAVLGILLLRVGGWPNVWVAGIMVIVAIGAAGMVGVHVIARTEVRLAELADRFQDLEQRNREIFELNGELRRQVGERSRELATALARLGPIAERSDMDASVVDGRYRKLRLLGRGGMGTVHEVERVSDGKRLALKTLQRATSGEDLARFAREAQIAAEMGGEHVVPVLDIGVTSSGTIFFVMELVEGGSLESERARFGDAAWAVPLLAQVARGIAALHTHGVIHRDLKPANILVDCAGRARIADFGISSLAVDPLGDTKAPGDALTVDGVALGTPLYMAPELAHGGSNATAAADVFSFGTLAYEVLAGKHPFHAPPVFLAVTLGASTTPPPLDAVSPQLASGIARALSFAPRDRPTIEELVLAMT